MKPMSGVLGCGLVLAVLSISASPLEAQILTGPIHWISNAHFDLMNQQGLLELASPATLRAQDQQVVNTTLQNQTVVENFLEQNPDLEGLAALAAAVPNPNNPTVRRTPDGDYLTTIVDSNGNSQVQWTMGQNKKLAGLANSILSWSDASVQLQIYTNLYHKLPQAFLNGPNPPISPSQLQGATQPTILSALSSLGSQWRTIASLIPPPAPLGPVACEEEVGYSSAANNASYGDQSTSDLPPSCFPPSTTCLTACVPSPPSSTGIIANLDFPSKSYLTCVKQQGNRPTCPAFAATSAIEELIAVSTGTKVNLSEQDYYENLAYRWAPDLYGSGFDGGLGLELAVTNNYQFAYENQWDYNPSWLLIMTPIPTCRTCNQYYAFVDSCLNYPSSEPGCSDSNPQAPEFCTLVSPPRPSFPIPHVECGFSAATLSSPPSPYLASSYSVVNIWHPGGKINPRKPGIAPDKALSEELVILNLLLNNAVILGFNLTGDYQTPAGGYVNYVEGDKSSTGGHNVHLVGAILNEDLLAKVPSAPPGAGGGYFIIKNSLGLCAGDAGYYYLPFDYVNNEAVSIYAVSTGAGGS